MPPSKIRKNLVGLVNLAPQIEDVLYEKIDLPLGTYLSIQKSMIQTQTYLSSRPSSTETETLSVLPIATLTTLLLKVGILLKAYTGSLNN